MHDFIDTILMPLSTTVGVKPVYDLYTACFKKSSPPPKSFWNIFTSVKSFFA